MPVQTVIKVRRDTSANWTTTNPVLASGELGLETDTNRFKFGNGTTAWASLAYSAMARTNTLTGWVSANPILANGEIGLETDTGKFKFGNGTATWTNLLYAGGESTYTKSFLLMGA